MANDEVAIVGAGRTGSRVARELASKVNLRIIDRDFLDEASLRQCVLYKKSDLNKMKAGALAKHLGTTFPPGFRHYKAICEHLEEENAEKLLGGCALVVDCTDNYATRIAINGYCWKRRVPWVFCSALREVANCSAIVPPHRPCFECWAPAPQKTESCSVAGVEEKALDAAAKKAVEQARQILQKKRPSLQSKLWVCEKGKEKTVLLPAHKNCACCGTGERKSVLGTTMCGSNEWLFLNKKRVNTREAARIMKGKLFEKFVRFRHYNCECNLFEDGRLLVKNSDKKIAEKINCFILSKLGT